MKDENKIEIVESVIEEFIEEVSLSELSSHLISIYADLGINP